MTTKLQQSVEILDDVVNSLSNYASLQKRNNDTVGSNVTKDFIKDIKQFIIDNQIDTNYYV